MTQTSEPSPKCNVFKTTSLEEKAFPESYGSETSGQRVSLSLISHDLLQLNDHPPEQGEQKQQEKSLLKCGLLTCKTQKSSLPKKACSL